LGRSTPRVPALAARAAAVLYLVSAAIAARTRGLQFPIAQPLSFLAIGGASLAVHAGLDLRRRLAAAEARADAGKAPRGKVTLVFTDIQGSTDLWERRPAAMRGALEIHNELMRRLRAKHGGYEVKTEGDAFMLAFADCPAAVAWCTDVQRELIAADWPA